MPLTHYLFHTSRSNSLKPLKREQKCTESKGQKVFLLLLLHLIFLLCLLFLTFEHLITSKSWTIKKINHFNDRETLHFTPDRLCTRNISSASKPLVFLFSVLQKNFREVKIIGCRWFPRHSYISDVGPSSFSDILLLIMCTR